MVCLGTWVVAAISIYTVGYFYVTTQDHVSVIKLFAAVGCVPGLGVIFGCVGAGFTDLILIVVWLKKKAAHMREQALTTPPVPLRE